MIENEDIGWVEIGSFVEKVLDQGEARKAAERSIPRISDNVEKTFTSAPIRTLDSNPPINTGRRVVAVGTGESATAAGAFYSMVTIVGGTDDGDIVLQGGQVLGGTGNELVDDITLYDASSVGTEWQGADGETLQLIVTGDGSETSGILDPIFNVTSTSIPAAVAALAANTLPESGSTGAKVCNISLGTFGDGAFYPALAGNIQVSFCWGGYTVSRF